MNPEIRKLLDLIPKTMRCETSGGDTYETVPVFAYDITGLVLTTGDALRKALSDPSFIAPVAFPVCFDRAGKIIPGIDAVNKGAVLFVYYIPTYKGFKKAKTDTPRSYTFYGHNPSKLEQIKRQFPEFVI